MYISSIQIHNYKCFHEPERLELKPGVNVVTGQNNAGKSALLEALSLAFANSPHRSLATVPREGDAPGGICWVEFTVVVGREELHELLLTPGRRFLLAVPRIGTPEMIAGGVPDDKPESMNRFAAWFLDHELHSFELWFTPGGLGCARLPSFGTYAAKQAAPQLPTSAGVADGLAASYVVGENRFPSFRDAAQSRFGSEVGTIIGAELRGQVYLFRAERFNMGACAVGASDVLKPNCGNLPEVLGKLQGNPGRFARFTAAVRQVLPQIKLVSVRTVRTSEEPLHEILVWTEDPAQEREDLTVPLNKSGTGVGQVLAILYVVMNSPSSRTILIDEPQSFLHPGAVRRLLSVLREHPQHQYVLASHSPLVVTAAEPATLTQVRQNGAQSTFRSIDPKKNEELRELLADVGARLSDVFGADAILWVEGATEELCFPLILEKTANFPLRGTAIIGVRSTGELEGRQARAAYEIYERLSQAGATLLPPAVGFVFDRERRSDAKLAAVENTGHGRVKFLPRRMYENYLLMADAIAAVGNTTEGFRDEPLTADEVERWIDKLRTEEAFGGSAQKTNSACWRIDIDGARLLERLFTDLSEARVSFSKTTHSVELTRWIIANAPGELAELAQFLKEILSRPVIGDEPQGAPVAQPAICSHEW
ncbi:MAG TPA: AAA family ATPase [Armatimonadota bacterium]|nr:AAA family ATPase [Armatimonadota bacterium]